MESKGLQLGGVKPRMCNASSVRCELAMFWRWKLGLSKEWGFDRDATHRIQAVVGWNGEIIEVIFVISKCYAMIHGCFKIGDVSVCLPCPLYIFLDTDQYHPQSIISRKIRNMDSSPVLTNYLTVKPKVILAVRKVGATMWGKRKLLHSCVQILWLIRLSFNQVFFL